MLCLYRLPDNLFVCTHFRCAIVLYFFGTAFQAIVGCVFDSEGVAPGYSPRAKGSLYRLPGECYGKRLRQGSLYSLSDECYALSPRQPFLSRRHFLLSVGLFNVSMLTFCVLKYPSTGTCKFSKRFLFNLLTQQVPSDYSLLFTLMADGLYLPNSTNQSGTCGIYCCHTFFAVGYDSHY